MKKIDQIYNKISTIKEDEPVISFLKNIPKDKSIAYLEVGAGLGRFPLLLRDELKMPNLDITCLDINENLVSKLKEFGFKTYSSSSEKMPLKDDQFDIVHCSHMIEHLYYPDIVKVLDELVRITRIGGHIIIRSPLMHPGFWNNIDHVRPYPPKTILLYFGHEQQQRTSNHSIELISEWIRRGKITCSWRIPGVSYINDFLTILWNKFGFPSSKPTGYVAIFKKK